MNQTCSAYYSLNIFHTKSQNCRTNWAGHMFPYFVYQFILDGNPTTYWLKNWFSDAGSFVFLKEYFKRAFQWYIIWPYLMKLIFHPWEMSIKNCPNFWEERPVLKAIKFDILSWQKIIPAAPKFGSRTLSYCPYYQCNGTENTVWRRCYLSLLHPE